MKFNLSYPFTIEVGENIYKGTLREPTKSETKSMKKILDGFNDILKDVKKIRNKIDVANAKLGKDNQNEKLILDLQKLNEELDLLSAKADDLNIMEATAKMRLELCFVGDKEIIDLANDYGYTQVFNTIKEDIEEKKKIDKIN